tara:strand:+ start:4282 stop:5001 length:720 start_codon:yes stop_codon:yes gene_type:complete
MPATSKKQQKFMGLVRALQKGKVSPSKVSKKVKDVAKDMKPKDVKKYASTKHKGLPNKVKSEAKKMSDKDVYNYLMYMKKFKPDIWRDLQGNKKVKKIMKKFESINEKACWSGYKQIGMKKKNGKKVPNCVPESYDVWNEETGIGYTLTLDHCGCEDNVNEAEYKGRKVKLNKPMQGDKKKFKVYVKNPKGNVVPVHFGQKGARIKKSNPERRSNFRARHNCDNPGPRHKARYWSCKKW